jgi:porin
MKCLTTLVAAGILLVFAHFAIAEETPTLTLPAGKDALEAETPAGPAAEEPSTLTHNWFGAGEKLAEAGLSIKLSLTQIYQDVARGTTTHRHSGRYTGSYDLEIEADLEKMAGLKGGSLYILTEGGWSPGVDPASVGSLFGVNADAFADRTIIVTEFRYDQRLLDDKLHIRIGKLDLTGGFECHGCPVAFDCNAFANDETSQFLNGALVNNPTIPFPERGLGAVVFFRPVEHWYAAAGVGDGRSKENTTGFNTAFGSGTRVLSLAETGYIAELPSENGPMHGAYRIGMWYDSREKDRFDGTDVKRGDTGMYVSADQVLYRENADPKDTQGLGVFSRFGLADQTVNAIRMFWSAGAQYQGLIPLRDNDVLGIGLARGRVTDSDDGAGAKAFTRAHETVVETYYNIQVAPWLNVSPSVQYVADPGAQKGARDAVIVGVRVQMAF